MIADSGAGEVRTTVGLVVADPFPALVAPNLPLERWPFPAVDVLKVRTLAGIKPASLTVTKRTTAKMSEADKMADIPGTVFQARNRQLAVL